MSGDTPSNPNPTLDGVPADTASKAAGERSDTDRFADHSAASFVEHDEIIAGADAIQTRERLNKSCEEFKKMLVGLLDAKGKVAEEIHAIRKHGKCLRGGFGLFRLGKSAALEIQAIGRLLSEPRDAVSRYNTWKKLQWNRDPILAAAIEGLLEQQTHSVARRPPAETITWCLARVNAASAELQALPEETLEDRITKGFDKLKHKAVTRCRKLDPRNEEDFHDARKALKAWTGAIGFLHEGPKMTDPVLHELAEVLGDENDLTTFSLWLEEHGFTTRFAPDLWRQIAASRRRLQRQVIKDGTRLRKSPGR